MYGDQVRTPEVTKCGGLWGQSEYTGPWTMEASEIGDGVYIAGSGLELPCASHV